MTSTINLNGTTVVRARMVQPWAGNWFADLELDPLAPIPPIGPAILTIGVQPYRCFIDANASGIFGAKVGVRVVGGLGGWSRELPAQHFHNDALVLSSIVIAATAALVGEIATVALPVPLGTDYVRARGPASRVLEGLDWHVEPTSGATFVGPRIPAPANPLTVEVLDYDPIAQRATVATDGVLSPGAVLVDPRFGTLTVRDVEQTWGEGGARANVLCGAADVGARLVTALKNLAKQATPAAHLRTYRYRVIAQNRSMGG